MRMNRRLEHTEENATNSSSERSLRKTLLPASPLSLALCAACR